MTAPLQPHRDGTTELPDGRTLGWAMFGDPEGDTVFWFHGTPGARHQLPHDAGDLARDRGLRIVCVERPGTGDSSEHVYPHILDFTADLARVIEDIDVDEFAVVGLSGGGPYLLATAHEFPDRMRAGVVLGGIGPTRGTDSIVSHTMLLVPAAAVLERLRTPLVSGLRAVVHAATPYADIAVDTFFRFMPGDHAHFTARPLDRRQFTADLIDANERSGLGSAIADLILFGRHWGFELRNIDVPVIFYGGSSDIIVPYLHAERQSKRVPGSRLRTYEGRGHFAGYTSPADILDDVRELWPQAGHPAQRATTTTAKAGGRKAGGTKPSGAVPAAKKAPAKKAAAKRTPARKAPAKKAPAKKAAAKRAAAKRPSAAR